MTIASFYEKWVSKESKLPIPVSRRDR